MATKDERIGSVSMRHRAVANNDRSVLGPDLLVVQANGTPLPRRTTRWVGDNVPSVAGARSLWLASGLPGNHQAWAAVAHVPHRVATVAYGESYWGGCARVADFLARDGGYHVLRGMYRHAREDTQLGIMAAALARL